MSYPKKRAEKKGGPKYNPKLSQKRRDKLIALQQKEQLKSLLVTKFVEKYGKVKGNKEFISKEVNALLKSGKISETNLKALEDKIKTRLKIPTKAPSVHSHTSKCSHHSKQQPKQKAPTPEQAQEQAEVLSDTSSQRARSVYMGGNEKDEWATIMKFDTELFKKEQEMEKLRLAEQKKKMRADLQRQIAEKDKLRQRDREEDHAYFKLQQQQMSRHDGREMRKANEMKDRLLQEKLSRDKQLKDENLRKRYEHKKEKDLDQRMVKQIEKELSEEQTQTMERRNEERVRLRAMLEENEKNKVALKEEAERQRLRDIQSQKEYTRLIEAQEKKRADEMADREKRQRQFMDMMAETVIKDHKAKQELEDKRILAQYLARERAEMDDEDQRRQKLYAQKISTKNYLIQQVSDKKDRQRNELKRDKIQAEIWKKEAQEYLETEAEKSAYIRELNKEHQSILLSMFKENEGVVMDENELLMNKGQLKNCGLRKKQIKPHYKKLYQG